MRPEFGNHLSQSEQFKARFEFVKANRHRMTIAELAEATGTAKKTITCYLVKLNKIDKPKEEKPIKRGYATWADYRTRRQLHDDFRGWF